MKLIKKLFIAISVFALITMITLWVLAKMVKPAMIKDYVSSQLTSMTAQQSRINGDISWQIFPRPGIKITGVHIGCEDGKGNYSIKLEKLLFNLKITPLLRGKFVFSELDVDGFKINIHPETKPIQVKKPTPSGPVSKVDQQFAIERFLLSRGQIIITQNQKDIIFSNLQIGAEQLNLQKVTFPLQFKSDFEVASSDESLLKASVNFKGSTALSSALFNNPLAAFQQIPLDGQLSVQDLEIKQVMINKISANVKNKTGLFLLNPLTLTLYNGESVGNLSYEFATATLKLNQTATDLDGSKLVDDLMNKKWLKGNVDFSIHTQTSLQNTNWKDNTKGKGHLTVKDGLVDAVNLEKLIDEMSNKISQLLNGRKEDLKTTAWDPLQDPTNFKGTTPFKLLAIQYSLKEGKLQSHSLVLLTDKLQLKGDGEWNLKDNILNSHLLAKVSLANPEVDKIQQLLGGSFPILIKGSITDLILQPDLKMIYPILTKIWIKSALLSPIKAVQKQTKIIAKYL